MTMMYDILAGFMCGLIGVLIVYIIVLIIDYFR